MDKFWDAVGELGSLIGGAVVIALVVLVTVSIVDRHPREK